MTNLVLLAVATLIATEILVRLDWKGKMAEMANLARKMQKVVASKAISDHHKEKAVPAYAFRVAGKSAIVTFYFLLILVPFVLIAFVLEEGTDAGEFFGSLQAIGVMCVVSIGYFLFRTKVVPVK